MITEVDQAFRDVERVNVGTAFEFLRRANKLVFAKLVDREIVIVGQLLANVVRVQHGVLASALDSFATERQDVSVSADADAEVPVERLHFADRKRTVVVQLVTAAVVLNNDRRRKERLEEFLDADRAGTGAAAAVRGRERLVQVVVDDVEAHIAGARDAHNGVQVRAVVIKEPARFVRKSRYFKNIRFKQAERVRVRQHQTGDVGAEFRLQVFKVDAAAFVRLDDANFVTDVRRAGRVRAVRRVRNQNDAPLFVVAAMLVVSADNHNPGRFAVRARRRLERKRVHSADLRQHQRQLVHQLERALRRFDRLVRVNVRETGKTRRVFAEFRIVFHRAGAERVHAVVDAERSLRKRGKVPHRFDFAKFRKAERRFAPVFLRKRLLEVDFRQVLERETEVVASFNVFFVKKFHSFALLSTRRPRFRRSSLVPRRRRIGSPSCSRPIRRPLRAFAFR